MPFRLRDLAMGVDSDVREFPGIAYCASKRIPTLLKRSIRKESKMAWVAIEDQRKEEYPPALKVLKFKVLLPNS